MKILSSHYFRKMLALLLFTGLLPVAALGASFISIYGQSLKRATVDNALIQVRQVANEMDGLLSQSALLSQTCASQLTVKSVLSYLPGKVELATLEQALTLLTLDKADRFALHAVGAAHQFSTTQLPPHYQFDVFSQTPLYATLDSRPRSSVFFAQPYSDAQGRQIALSVVMPVSDYYDRFVGYTLVDIYQSAFISLLDRLGAALDMAVWYDGALLCDTAALGLPTSQAVQALPGYTAQSASEGMGWQGDLCYFWNRGEYNRLNRVFCLDTSHLSSVRQAAVTLLAALLALTAALAAALAVSLSIHQSRPILRLSQAMDEVGQGDLSVQAPVTGQDELACLSKRFNLLVRQLDKSTREQAAREEELRKQQIAALQAQINPHFLYNSLGAARSLIRMGAPGKASEIIVHLSTLLHANLQSVDQLIPLQEDIRLIHSYMIIQNIRFNDRFTLDLDIPQELERCLLPTLILQPIVENSVKHGLEPKAGRGRVNVSVRRENDKLVLTVTDDGVGIPLGIEQDLNATHPVGGHIGYLNVRRRIELFYGSGCTARIEGLSQGTRVMLLLKYVREDRPCSDC